MTKITIPSCQTEDSEKAYFTTLFGDPVGVGEVQRPPSELSKEGQDASQVPVLTNPDSGLQVTLSSHTK